MSDKQLGIMHRLEKVIRLLNEIKVINDELQAKCAAVGHTRMWQKHENIDDKLHDALAALGDL